MTESVLARIAPSTSRTIEVSVTTELPESVEAVAVPVTTDGEVAGSLGIDRAGLTRAGFSAAVGQALAFPTSAGPVPVAVGAGPQGEFTAAIVRDAAAAFARAVPQDARLAVRVPSGVEVSAGEAAAAIVEGILLTRYRYHLRSVPAPEKAVEAIILVAEPGQLEEVQAGADRGLITAKAAMLGRDLASAPASLLTAPAFGELATEIGAAKGLTVDVYDKAQVTEMGLGGLLGVNRGSVLEPRMIVLRYQPAGESTGHLALVGKGIMYDSGGICLKPGDLSHSQMKNDMTGAGNIMAAMSALAELNCPAQVTGYLMCTDNMPSGSAMELGDVLTMRNGRTVEVLNSDAEGRLVMADGLCLAVEDGAEAIIDIATLTGAALRTFGVEFAAVMGTDPGIVAGLIEAGASTDEPLWELPLVSRYRNQLDSTIADMTNMGGEFAGSITAGLFLKEFVDEVPWAHVDIAGTAQSPTDRRWIPKGPTAFGSRLLIDYALGFTRP